MNSMKIYDEGQIEAAKSIQDMYRKGSTLGLGRLIDIAQLLGSTDDQDIARAAMTLMENAVTDNKLELVPDELEQEIAKLKEFGINADQEDKSPMEEYADAIVERRIISELEEQIQKIKDRNVPEVSKQMIEELVQGKFMENLKKDNEYIEKMIWGNKANYTEPSGDGIISHIYDMKIKGTEDWVHEEMRNQPRLVADTDSKVEIPYEVQRLDIPTGKTQTSGYMQVYPDSHHYTMIEHVIADLKWSSKEEVTKRLQKTAEYGYYLTNGKNWEANGTI